MAETAWTPPLNLLYCYAPEDRQWPEIIDARLQDLKRQCQIVSRFDGELVPTPDQKARLLALFENLDIGMVLLLVSPHFQAVESFWQELCQEAEKKIYWPALLAGYRVVAFVLEPVAWNHAPALAREILPREGIPPRAERESEPLQPLEAFPNDVKPLSRWSNQKQAFEQTVRWLRLTIERHWLARGEYHAFEEMGAMAHLALVAYDEALRLNPLLKEAWHGKAVALLYARQHEEALEKWHRHDPALKDPQTGKPLMGPKLYEEALQASEEALRLDPTYHWAWQTKAFALAGLKRHKEAHQARKIARQLGLPV